MIVRDKNTNLKEGQGLLLVVKLQEDVHESMTKILPIIANTLAKRGHKLQLQDDLKDIIFVGTAPSTQLTWKIIDINQQNTRNKTFFEICQDYKENGQQNSADSEIIGPLEAASLLLLCPELCIKAGDLIPSIWLSGCQLSYKGQMINCALRLKYDDGGVYIYKEHPRTNADATVPITSLLYCLATGQSVPGMTI
jgi:hypothetical protein